jgi:hypothetical protein
MSLATVATMNGTGYDFTSSSAFNQLESLAQSLNEQQRGKRSNSHDHHQQQQQQQQQQVIQAAYKPSTGAYHVDALSGNRPESLSYDPTTGSNTNSSSQHRLLMASMANAYGHAATSAAGSASSHHSASAHHHQQQQQSHSNSNLAALFGSSGLADLLPLIQLQQQQQQQQQTAMNPYGISSIIHDQAYQSHQHGGVSQLSKQHSTSPHLLGDSNFDDLLMLHSGLLGQGQDTFPSLILSNNIPVTAIESMQQPPPPSIESSMFGSSNLDPPEPWLEEISMNVPSLSLEPLSGVEVEKRLRGNVNDVLTRYIPCVDFLVQCQQDLRKGLEYATSRQARSGRRRGSAQNMTASEFFNMYVDQLPRTFYKKNFRSMDHEALEESYQGLQKLRQDARNSERQGCEAVKSNFLGGMKDGESWGLRKWLSKHGNALTVCTDLECIMNACQKLDRSLESTRKLSNLMRPMAKMALDKLRSDIPSSYQQRSTAHPYLPFFHRLEAALRGISTFDPDDDDVICLDDSDDDDDDAVIVEEVKSASHRSENEHVQKRKLTDNATNNITVINEEVTIPPTPKRPALLKIDEHDIDDDSSSGESDTESVVEIIEALPTNDGEGNEYDSRHWQCLNCLTLNRGAYVLCQQCGEEAPVAFLPSNVVDNCRTPTSFDCNSSFDSSMERSMKNISQNIQAAPNLTLVELCTTQLPVNHTNLNSSVNVACAMADNIAQLALLFDESTSPNILPAQYGDSSFWYGCRFADALRLFVDLLRKPESPYFVEHVDEDSLIQAGNPPFSHVIKHPICFRDIVAALIHDVENNNTIQTSNLKGFLPTRGLTKWNMWHGSELLQAIDLVMLNSLAYGKAMKEGKSSLRSKTNQIRKDFWNGITKIISVNVANEKDKKRFAPTRRSESSGFVVYKINET